MWYKSCTHLTLNTYLKKNTIKQFHRKFVYKVVFNLSSFKMPFISCNLRRTALPKRSQQTLIWVFRAVARSSLKNTDSQQLMQRMFLPHFTFESWKFLYYAKIKQKLKIKLNSKAENKCSQQDVWLDGDF